jgi:opacity protein-like surface antigen
MKRTAVLLAILLAAAARSANADTTSDLYQLISNTLGIDPNAGVTTLGSLLIPMGGLDEGMGTAYTAVCKDSSYFESNPAASSLLDHTELSVFHNQWIADTKIEGLVYTIRYENLGFGIAGKWLYVPFPATDQFGDNVGAGYYSESMAGFNVSYDFFPGFYNSGLAVGATAKLAYRAMPAVSYVDTTTGEPDAVTTANNSALGVMVDGGLLYRFNFLKLYSSRDKNFSLGLAIRNLGPPVEGDPLPTDASFGLAYSPLKPWTLSFDLTKPIDLVNLSQSGTMNYAGGFLVQMSDFFTIHGGLLIQGGNPRITIGSSFDVSQVQITVNYTLDLTTQLTPLNRISVQAAFSLGDLGRGDIAKKVDSLYLSGLDAYAKGDIDGAIADWNEALKLDSSFDPARESRDAALASKGLKQTMTELQQIKPSP